MRNLRSLTEPLRQSQIKFEIFENSCNDQILMNLNEAPIIKALFEFKITYAYTASVLVLSEKRHSNEVEFHTLMVASSAALTMY